MATAPSLIAFSAAIIAAIVPAPCARPVVADEGRRTVVAMARPAPLEKPPLDLGFNDFDWWMDHERFLDRLDEAARVEISEAKLAKLAGFSRDMLRRWKNGHVGDPNFFVQCQIKIERVLDERRAHLAKLAGLAINGSTIRRQTKT